MYEVNDENTVMQVAIQLPVANEFVKQATQDAYDKGHELGCSNIHVTDLGGKPAVLEISAVGKEENLQALHRHLAARWVNAIHEDKHKADGQWLSFSITLRLGSFNLTPLYFTAGPKHTALWILQISFEHMSTKPKALIGGFIWNGNNKLMWSVYLCYMALEYMQIGRGAGDYRLY